MTRSLFTRRTATVATLSMLAIGRVRAAEATLLNVSYDPTRELYREINRAFVAVWKKKTGQQITINGRLCNESAAGGCDFLVASVPSKAKPAHLLPEGRS
jgi:ABC-type sulfate transport system substrate-binding protein